MARKWQGGGGEVPKGVVAVVAGAEVSGEMRMPKTAESIGAGTGRRGEETRDSSAVRHATASMQELDLADRLHSTSEFLLPHSLGLPSYRE